MRLRSQRPAEFAGKHSGFTFEQRREPTGAGVSHGPPHLFDGETGLAQQHLGPVHAPLLDVLGECFPVRPLEGFLEFRGAHAGDQGQIRDAQIRGTVVVYVAHHVVDALAVDGVQRPGLPGLDTPGPLDDESHRLEHLSLVVELIAVRVARLRPELGQQRPHLGELVATAQRDEGLLDAVELTVELFGEVFLGELGRHLDGDALNGDCVMDDASPGTASDALSPDGVRFEFAVGAELLPRDGLEPCDGQIARRIRFHDVIARHDEIVNADGPQGLLGGQEVKPSVQFLAPRSVRDPERTEPAGGFRCHERRAPQAGLLKRFLHPPVLSSCDDGTQICADGTEHPPENSADPRTSIY